MSDDRESVHSWLRECALTLVESGPPTSSALRKRLLRKHKWDVGKNKMLLAPDRKAAAAKLDRVRDLRTVHKNTSGVGTWSSKQARRYKAMRTEMVSRQDASPRLKALRTKLLKKHGYANKRTSLHSPKAKANIARFDRADKLKNIVHQNTGGGFTRKRQDRYWALRRGK